MFFVIRRLILVAIIFFPQRFWFRRGWELSSRIRSPHWIRASRAFLALAVFAIVATLVDRILFRFIPAGITAWLSPIVQLWVFTSTFTFFLIKIVHFIEWLWHTVTKIAHRALHRSAVREQVSDPSRRSFFRYAAGFIGTVPFLAALYGYALERLNFDVVRVDVPIANLPPALDGLRIVQLSDIHAGDFMPPDEIRRAVEMANALSPHLAVITGDLVSGYGDPIAPCVAELSRLQAPLGMWGCNGNHEIYAGVEDTAEVLYQQYGMTLLRHAASQLTWNGAKFNLIGVDYQRDVQLSGSRMPHLNGVDALLQPDMPNILLSHNPNSFYRAAAFGIDLTISGHTHGGQITLEIVNHNFSPARFMTKFIAGLYKRPKATNSENSHLYVNRGLGTLGVPARIGAPPEITLLTLRSG